MVYCAGSQSRSSQSRRISPARSLSEKDWQRPQVDLTLLYLFECFPLYFHSLRRAAKCYQKVLDLQPVNTEAAMFLGDVLTSTGQEVS